jgi:O-antigen/teichoic acid export membrane protein
LRSDGACTSSSASSRISNYLYAPAAMILINRMLDPEFVAYYEAAVQVDAALCC